MADQKRTAEYEMQAQYHDVDSYRVLPMWRRK